LVEQQVQGSEVDANHKQVDDLQPFDDNVDYAGDDDYYDYDDAIVNNKYNDDENLDDDYNEPHEKQPISETEVNFTTQNKVLEVNKPDQHINKTVSIDFDQQVSDDEEVINTGYKIRPTLIPLKNIGELKTMIMPKFDPDDKIPFKDFQPEMDSYTYLNEVLNVNDTIDYDYTDVNDNLLMTYEKYRNNPHGPLASLRDMMMTYLIKAIQSQITKPNIMILDLCGSPRTKLFMQNGWSLHYNAQEHENKDNQRLNKAIENGCENYALKQNSPWTYCTKLNCTCVKPDVVIINDAAYWPNIKSQMQSLLQANAAIILSIEHIFPDNVIGADIRMNTRLPNQSNCYGRFNAIEDDKYLHYQPYGGESYQHPIGDGYFIDNDEGIRDHMRQIVLRRFHLNNECIVLKQYMSNYYINNNIKATTRTIINSKDFEDVIKLERKHRFQPKLVAYTEKLPNQRSNQSKVEHKTNSKSCENDNPKYITYVDHTSKLKPEGNEHIHFCAAQKCGLPYLHAHNYKISDHIQREYQCPYEQCIWYCHYNCHVGKCVISDKNCHDFITTIKPIKTVGLDSKGLEDYKLTLQEVHKLAPESPLNFNCIADNEIKKTDLKKKIIIQKVNTTAYGDDLVIDGNTGINIIDDNGKKMAYYYQRIGNQTTLMKIKMTCLRSFSTGSLEYEVTDQPFIISATLYQTLIKIYRDADKITTDSQTLITSVYYAIIRTQEYMMNAERAVVATYYFLIFIVKIQQGLVVLRENRLANIIKSGIEKTITIDHGEFYDNYIKHGLVNSSILSHMNCCSIEQETDVNQITLNHASYNYR